MKILVLRESHNGRGKLRQNYQITNPRQHLCNFGFEFYAIYFFGTSSLVFLLLIKQENFSVDDSTDSVPPDGGPSRVRVDSESSDSVATIPQFIRR